MKTRTLCLESLENRFLFSLDVDLTYYDAAERYETIELFTSTVDVAYREDVALDALYHRRYAHGGVALKGVALGQATAYIAVEVVMLDADVNGTTYNREIAASGQIRHATAEIFIEGSGFASFSGFVQGATVYNSNITCCGVHEQTRETEMAYSQFFVVVWGNDWQIYLSATAGRDNWNDLRISGRGVAINPIYAQRAVAQFESNIDADHYIGMMMTSTHVGFTYAWDYGADAGTSEHFARNVSLVIAQGSGQWDALYRSEAPHFLQTSPRYARVNWLQSTATVTFSQPPAIVVGWLSSTVTDSYYGPTQQSMNLGFRSSQTYSTEAYEQGYSGGRLNDYDRVFAEIDDLLTWLFY